MEINDKVCIETLTSEYLCTISFEDTLIQKPLSSAFDALVV